MNINKLLKTDIKNALELIWDVFFEFEAPDYADQGVAYFKDFISLDSIMEKFDKDKMAFWGCFIDNNLAGVIASLGIGHISMLFVKKEYHRQGVAKRLFQTLLDVCKSDDNVKRITVNSSPYAVEVYHRMGFKDTNAEQTLNGIRFTPMEYAIT